MVNFADSCFNGDGTLDNLFPDSFNKSIIENIFSLETVVQGNIEDINNYNSITIENANEKYANGEAGIGIMHCVLSYPTDNSDANLLMIKNLKDLYPNYEIGYSDHTKPDENMLILTTAYLYGATILEKHYTLDKTLQGNDHYHGMDPEDIRKFNENIKLIKTINGQYDKVPLPCESESRKQARRSIIAKEEIKEGTVISEDMLTYKRPGTGISPSEIDKIIGKKAKINIAEDELIKYEYLE